MGRGTKAVNRAKVFHTLEAWLEVRGRDQTWLAGKIHVSPSAVSRWVTGKTPLTVAHLFAIAPHLGLQPCDLLVSPPDQVTLEGFDLIRSLEGATKLQAVNLLKALLPPEPPTGNGGQPAPVAKPPKRDNLRN